MTADRPGSGGERAEVSLSRWLIHTDARDDILAFAAFPREIWRQVRSSGRARPDPFPLRQTGRYRLAVLCPTRAEAEVTSR